MKNPIIKISYFLKALFLLALFFLISLSIINILFYFTHFKIPGFFPDNSIQMVYKYIFSGYKFAPPWVAEWLSSPYTSDASKTFFLLSYLIIGIIFSLVSLYAIYFLFTHKGGVYLIFLGFIFIFFVPFGYILGPCFMLFTLFVIVVNSEIEKLIKVQLEKNNDKSKVYS